MLNEDYRDMLHVLSEEKVKFLLYPSIDFGAWQPIPLQRSIQRSFVYTSISLVSCSNLRSQPMDKKRGDKLQIKSITHD